MTLNDVMALILRYFTELVYDVVVKRLPRFQNLLLIVYDNIKFMVQHFCNQVWCATGFCPVDISSLCKIDDVSKCSKFYRYLYVILYADDILLLAPTVTILEQIIHNL